MSRHSAEKYSTEIRYPYVLGFVLPKLNITECWAARARGGEGQIQQTREGEEDRGGRRESAQLIHTAVKE